MEPRLLGSSPVLVPSPRLGRRNAHEPNFQAGQGFPGQRRPRLLGQHVSITLEASDPWPARPADSWKVPPARLPGPPRKHPKPHGPAVGQGEVCGSHRGEPCLEPHWKPALSSCPGSPAGRNPHHRLVGDLKKQSEVQREKLHPLFVPGGGPGPYPKRGRAACFRRGGGSSRRQVPDGRRARSALFGTVREKKVGDFLELSFLPIRCLLHGSLPRGGSGFTSPG